MRYLIPVLLLLLPTFGCVTTPEGEQVPDWDKIDAAGDAIVNQLNAQIAINQADPDKVAQLERLKSVAQKIDGAVDAIKAGEGSFEELDTYLDAATAIVQGLQAEADPEDTGLLSALAAIQGSIDLIRIIAA